MNHLMIRAARPWLAWGAILFALLLSISTLTAAQTPPSSDALSMRPSESVPTQEAWLSVYWNGSKMGYSHIKSGPGDYLGHPAIEATSYSVMNLTMLGFKLKTEETSATLSDLNNQPLEQTFNISSNGSVSHVVARYDYSTRKITCTVGSGNDKSTETIDIPAGANLAGDSEFLTAGRKLAVGEKMRFLYLQPLSVRLENATAEVTGRETVEDATTGRLVSALVVRSDMEEGQSTEWETDAGDLVKAEMSMGGIQFTMISEPKAIAMETAGPTDTSAGAMYRPPSDFAVATAIRANRQIADPRGVRVLQARISGVPDRRFVLSDDRQREHVVGDPSERSDLTVDVTVRDKPFPEVDSAKLPIKNGEHGSYLGNAAYIDTEAPEIKSAALRIRGSETNLYRIAASIRDWVHRVMTPDGSIGVPRSARDVFRNRRGVCRDYATLYTALARAAGVPTRLCAGIVYSQNRFYYHAWAESFVGKWVTMDPTLYEPSRREDYVDATHIKFAQGNPLDMFNVVSIVGKLKVTITGVEM